MTDLDAKEVAWVAQLAGSRDELTAIDEDDAMATGHEPGLTEAWAAAEAALPGGYRLIRVQSIGSDNEWSATAWRRNAPDRVGHGPTPAAALLSLAAALRSHTDG